MRANEARACRALAVACIVLGAHRLASEPVDCAAHSPSPLERYADRAREGVAIPRGDVIGFVGTSGNAPENTPHLHFAIFEMTEKKEWWRGTPIDPYLVLVP